MGREAALEGGGTLLVALKNSGLEPTDDALPTISEKAGFPVQRVAAAPGGKYQDGRWFEVSALPALAYDHLEMAQYALGRLRAKLEYTNIACNLLPETFTFAELEALYAMILKRPIDRRNFRRRILSMGILRRLPATRRGAHRPAALYSFARRDPQVVEML